MKQLLVVRHAKSSWSSPSLSDFDRPLNDRGHRDAPEMARRLKARKMIPDLLISSPAARAWRTMQYFAKALELKEEKILAVAALYHAPVSVFYEAIHELRHYNDANTVALFSHNPGITEFVNDLRLVQLDNMPTCGVFAFQIETDNWASFKNADKTFLFFDYPKLKV